MVGLSGGYDPMLADFERSRWNSLTQEERVQELQRSLNTRNVLQHVVFCVGLISLVVGYSPSRHDALTIALLAFGFFCICHVDIWFDKGYLADEEEKLRKEQLVQTTE